MRGRNQRMGPVGAMGAMVAAACCMGAAAQTALPPEALSLRITGGVEQAHGELEAEAWGMNTGSSGGARADGFSSQCFYAETFLHMPISINDVVGWSASGGVSVTTAFGSRALRVNYQSSIDATGFARSPLFDVGVTDGMFEADIRLVELGSTNEAATKGFETVNTIAGIINTRVLFLPGGDISVVQVEDGAGVTLPTTGSWTPDVTTRIGVRIYPDGSLDVYQDGDVIFSGHDVANELGNGVGANAIGFGKFLASGRHPFIIDNIECFFPVECSMENPCPSDLSGDGLVGSADLGILLGTWGNCP